MVLTAAKPGAAYSRPHCAADNAKEEANQAKVMWGMRLENLLFSGLRTELALKAIGPFSGGTGTWSPPWTSSE